MVQNKQSHRHSLCSVMSHVVLFAYLIMLNISTGSRVTIKGLKETTHGYKKNETKRMISRANCNTMFLFFLTADSQI